MTSSTTSTAPKKRIYPWIHPIITNQEDSYVYNLMTTQFDKHGYPKTYEKPTNRYFSEKLIEIMDYIDPSVGNAGNWVIIASNNESWLRDFSIIIPMTYSLTYRLYVHPTDPFRFNTIIRNRYKEEDEIPYLPYGLDMFKSGASLILFEGINRPIRYNAQFAGNAGDFFSGWLGKKWISVVATAHYEDFFNQEAADHMLSRISQNYGTPAKYGFNNKGVTFVVHDEEIRTKSTLRK